MNNFRKIIESKDNFGGEISRFEHFELLVNFKNFCLTSNINFFKNYKLNFKKGMNVLKMLREFLQNIMINNQRIMCIITYCLSSGYYGNCVTFYYQRNT